MDIAVTAWWQPWMEPVLAAFMAALAALVVWGCVRPSTSDASEPGTAKPADERSESLSLQQAQPLRAEVAELRASIGALEARMQAMKQRQELQLQMTAVSSSNTITADGMTTEDVIVLARQGWSAKELARVAGLSHAEAELLTRLHGQAQEQSPGSKDAS